MRLPELLDSDMKPLCALSPVKLTLRLRLKPLSLAEMTLPPDAPEVVPGDFIRIHTDTDSGVYRVFSAETVWPGGLTRLRLRHGLCTLSDGVVFGTWDFLGLDTDGDTGAVITTGVVRVRRARLRASASGSSAVLATVTKDEQVAITGAKRSWYAVTYGSVKGWMSKSCVTNTLEPVLSLRDVTLRLLETQAANAVRWTLGDFGVEQHQGASFTDCNALTALLTLTQVASEACEWRFDQSVTPWRLSLMPPESGVTCELRMARNLEKLTLRRTREDLCTRLYPSGKDGLTIEELTDGVTYIDSGSEQVTERILLLPEEQNAAALLRRGQVKLDSMDGPGLQAEAEAVDLYRRTGEPLDRLSPGANCRLHWPGGCAVLRITELTYPDLLHQPERVTVSLAGPRSTLASLLNQAGSADRVI